jgi:ELWxxDGT repeat protein
MFGTELWKSDGTEAGTTRVRDINFGAANSTPSALLAVDPLLFNTDLFFVADDGVNGRELWRSDGTDAGTAIVRDINSGSGDSFPSSLTAINGVLFFAAYDGPVRGRELWKSDGTEVGTALVKDINTDMAADAGYSSPSFFTNVNGTLFFSANDGFHKVGLWKSDGTDAGSSWITSFNPSGTDPGPLYFAVMSSTLFFQANNAICGGVSLCGVELWQTDGTGAGTAQVKDINPETEGDSGPSFLTPVNTAVFFFTAFDGPASTGGGDHGVELWKSDGTVVGTCLVKDIWSGITTSNPFGLTAMNGELFFSADDGNHGVELWKSDGTDTGSTCGPTTGSGTVLVKDIQP